MGRRLPPGEAERRKKERSRTAWAKMNSGEAYKHFNPNDGHGYGDESQWRGTAEERLGVGSLPAMKVDADLALLGLQTLPKDHADARKALYRAYRLASRTAHPDAPGGSHEAFLALKEAYDRLLKAQPKG